MRRQLFVAAVLLAVIMAMAVNAQETHLIIGGQLGQFAPSDKRLKGRGMLYNYNQSGIDEAWEVIGFIGYRRGNIEYRMESGVRSHDHKYYSGSTFVLLYKSQLKVYPIAVSAIYRFSSIEKGIIPFIGIGTGFYISRWREYSDNGIGSPNLVNGDAVHPGYHVLAGANYEMGHFYVTTGIRYSVIYGDWEFTGRNEYSARKVTDLNIGGVSLRVGLGYEL